MRAGRFRENVACPGPCPLCDALRQRHLPVGLCPDCDHSGGVALDGLRYKLEPAGKWPPDGPGISTL